MAWVDDRIWCLPKFDGLSEAAFAVWVRGVAFSSGMNTRGVLTASQQTLIRSTPKVRFELVSRALWDELSEGGVYIHDWDDHNAIRDDRKARDRERKREERRRMREGQNDQCPVDSPVDGPLDMSVDASADRRTLKGEG